MLVGIGVVVFVATSRPPSSDLVPRQLVKQSLRTPLRRCKMSYTIITMLSPTVYPYGMLLVVPVSLLRFVMCLLIAHVSNFGLTIIK